MSLRQIQRCSSQQAYTIFEIPSQSQEGLSYEVYSIFPEDPPQDYICSCPSFCYRGRCAHQDMAFHDRCLWDELEGPEAQTEAQKSAGQCPRCGGETFKTVEVIE